MKQITIYIAFLGMLTACKKDEISTASSASAAVYFIYDVMRPVNIDSISYTFVEKSSTVVTDTLWLPVRVSGDVADKDRPVNLVADNAGTTAEKDKHYKLLNNVIPKGSFTARLGVVLLRDASLQNNSVALNLRLQPSEDFPVLMKDTLMDDGRYYGRNKVKIIFTDRLLKPDNWESYLITFFGAYSNVKFRFITGVLGVSSFSTTGPKPVNYPRMQFYQNTVRNALLEYTTANGPLIDENNNVVVIP
ncbi:MAG: DUF4843 domain-containing protein [Pseudobacter sp.]|uniref:DUF4843 domain-containing protein n=1 Tax=Pseudobacter sp. TaxID=2045420 RepID=UPI003F81812C